MFLVSSIDYDRTLREDGTTNRMVESINFFRTMWSSPFLKQSGFILFLNKQDLLQEKIEADNGESLAETFPAFRDYKLSSGGCFTEKKKNTVVLTKVSVETPRCRSYDLVTQGLSNLHIFIRRL
jgi:hypothetical protein